MTAWLAITVAAVARHTIGTRAHSGCMPKNGWSVMDLRERTRLVEVVEKQAWKYEREPRHHDWSSAEMAEVDVECLSAGDEEDRA